MLNKLKVQGEFFELKRKKNLKAQKGYLMDPTKEVGRKKKKIHIEHKGKDVKCTKYDKKHVRFR